MIGQHNIRKVIQHAEKLSAMTQAMVNEDRNMAGLLSVIFNKSQDIYQLAQSIESQPIQGAFDSDLGLRARQLNLCKRLKAIQRRRDSLASLPVLGVFFKRLGKQKQRGLTSQLSDVETEIQVIVTKEVQIKLQIASLNDLVFELSQTILELKQRRFFKSEKALQIESGWYDLYQVWHGLNGLSYLNQTTYRSFVHYFLKEERRLRSDGWQGMAILIYQSVLVEKSQQTENKEGLLLLQKSIKRNSRLVGSPLYEAMYAALEGATNDQIKWKAQLPISHLGGYIDHHGMLQLRGAFHFSPDVSPDSHFWEEYAETVKKAYPKGLLPAAYGVDPLMTEYQMIKAIHQFRMYVDRQNIFYIRANYQGATDYDKLKAFEKEAVARVGLGGRLDYSSNSKFHNRTSQQLPFHGQHNDKIRSHNGLSEFIVRVKTGSFATQWDVLRTVDQRSFFIKEGDRVIGLRSQLVNSNPEDYDLQGLSGKEIVDTESFNYSARDKRKLGDISHSLLDVDPANGRLGLEHDVKILAKKTWKTQSLKSYGRNGRDSYQSPLPGFK
ncbi:DUF3114 domain-containing protein [uncultured Vagococcus sp.]|uniref:DUF3114 domain-containing protein n=1 Tax=uncultured Vagococcus sp. TaxID=189676 RepID=UPI0028D3EF9F|nr:DUF3114 domain-containing protein [uncultured Vagococcus sp.]